ncbi:MAG TPA: hypothetical protein VF203_15115 [Burkholderiales bacterium]
MAVATPWLDFGSADTSTGTTRLCASFDLVSVWLNPSNALAAGGGEAQILLAQDEFSAVSESRYLRVMGLQGLAAFLPESAVIEGIEVRVSRRFTRSGGSTFPQDCHAHIVKGGNLGAVNAAKAGSWPLNTLADAVYGGATDLWGGESWTRADLLSPSFGFALKVYRQTDDGHSLNCFVDHVQARIHYDPGPAAMFLAF